MDLDLKSLENLVDQNIGEKYISILTTQGEYIYDQDPEYIIKGLTIWQANYDHFGLGREIFKQALNNKCTANCKSEFNIF